VGRFQTTDPTSIIKENRKHMFNEKLFDLALDLRLSETIFGSFPAKQTGAVTSSI